MTGRGAAVASAPVVRLVDAITSATPAAVAEECDPHVRLRALTPLGFTEDHGPHAVAARYSGWFGSAELMGADEVVVREVAGRWRASYRLSFRFHEADGVQPVILEQHLFCEVEAARITRIDLVCSGFRPSG